jgi:hypothetical protein
VTNANVNSAISADTAATKTALALVKADVGLGSVDNTADTAKPVSTAQQTALDLKADIASPTFTGTVGGITATMVGLGNVTNIAQTSVTGLTGTQSVAAFKTGLTLVKADVGLGSVDNTADTAKPVSTAQQAALDLKVNLTRSVATTAPLTGGGDMSADRTLAISAATTSAAGSMSAADKIKVDAALSPVTGLSGAIGATIADYFTSTISLEASSIYEIECHAYFLKTTNGTVVWTWTFGSAPTVAQSTWDAGPITGFTTALVNGTQLFGHAVQEASTTLAHAASGSLTTAVRHSFRFRVRVRTNAATTIQLRATESAGTITPQTGSYMRANKIV